MIESTEPTNLPSLPTSREEVDTLVPSRVPLPRAVQNGFQLRQSNQELPFKTFTYTPAIPSETPPTPVNWHLLASFHVEGEHIRLHELKEEQDLKALIEEYRSEHAKAVVVVNSNETHKLPDDIVTTLKNFEGYLIAVISSSDGTTLFDCLETQFQDEDVYAKLEITSVNDTPLAILWHDEDTVVLEMDPTLPQYISDPQNRGFLSKLFGSSGRTYDLKGDVKKLMFDGEIMMPVISDAGVFTLVMSKFTQYEKSCKPDPNQVKELLQKFLKYFDPDFHKEFPFFITLAHRLRTYRHLYECDELGPFVTRCISTFEGLPPQQIAETLNHFIDQKDFDIMYGPEGNMSVFQLLATACIEMMNLSSQIKRSYQRQVDTPLNRFIYFRILWISVHLKCLSEKGTITKRSADDIWLKHLLRISQTIELKREAIVDFKHGLSFTSLLQLPPEIQFTAYHMTHFLANEQFVRPLMQARDFILALESNIRSDREFLILLLVNLRSLYHPFLSSSSPKDIGCASQEDTVLGVLDEGISFLDWMTELWFHRGWHKGEQHKDFRNECLKWLRLLLKTVKVTDPSAPQLLKKFLAQRLHGVVADQEFRNNIVKQILEDTRNSFPSLSIQLFFTLYKTFHIWPIDFLHEFLKQYYIPDTVKINDATWSEFFSVVLERYPGGEHQHHLLTFLCKVGERYKETGRSKEFIPDLLQLDVPQLFIIPTDANQEMEEASVSQKFSSYLKSYIQRNNLQSVILDNMQTILSKLTDKPGINFHWIISSALPSVIVPELKTLQTTDNEHLCLILSVCVNNLCTNIEWFGPLSERQNFCWGVVSTVCSKLLVTAENFDWIIQYQSIISQLGVVFNAYCNTRKLYDIKCLLSDYTPDEVQHCPWDDVNKYFQWVCKVQDVLRFWQTKFLQYQLNYDEILCYANNNVALSALGQAVCALSLVMDFQDICQFNDGYTYCFEQLNVYLLRYVPGYPEVKYCTLPALLTKYGVGLPPHIREVISKKVIFPGEQNMIKNQSLKNVIPPPSTRLFEPGQDITLKVSKLMTLSDIQQLLEDIMKFIEPLVSYLDTLVFFYLHQSEMFEKYLLKRMQAITNVSTLSITEVEESSSPSVACNQEVLSMGVSIETLQQAVEWVEDLLLRMLNGTATYEYIITEGALKWDLDKEFSILSRFSDVMEIRKEDCKGLQRTFSILELFQFTYHIQSIYDVCEQYGLVNCLEDHTLKELMVIIEELRPEGALVKLAPHEAIQKVNIIKRSLHLKEQNVFSCLRLFSAVTNNTNVYQFIQDKQFVGPRLSTFHEQYQLITAQMKHNETVMNHLLGVFEFLTPLLDQQDITFPDLMSKVSHLDTTYCLKQLETVNENMSLIQLWFSRFEDETLSFDNALSTGSFNFQLSDVQSDENETFQPQQFKVDEQNLTSEQIADYARRLGFFDAEEAAMKQRISKHYQDKYYQLEEIHQQQLTRHSQLQDEYMQLQENRQQQQEEHYKLDMTHKQQQKEYTKLQMVHQQQNEELSQLQDRHRHIQEDFFQLQEAYQQKQRDHSQLYDDFIKLQTAHQQEEEEYSLLQKEHQQQQKEFSRLRETHQQQQEQFSQLQRAHQQQRNEFSQLQDSHQQQQEQFSQLQRAHQQQRNEFSQLQDSHQQQQEQLSKLHVAHQKQIQDHHQLQEILEQTQKELGTKQEEMDHLHRKISAMEDSWKVSHREVTFTDERLGRGAWGAIRVAMFREQRVAVKQMHELIIDEDTLELLHREINTMAQLRHPNLLQFIGAVLDDPSGNPMIITEIMDTSLRNAYETKQLIPDPSYEAVLLTIMRDVAVGLNYLHCLPDPIIHRDVSSANVLLESKGCHKWKTKISDFGSANKARQAVTRGRGAFVYSAPESIPSVHVHVQNPLTTKVDVHSYGVLLCEIMTCRFPDPPVFQEMLQHVRSRAPPLFELIISCIKKDPDNRPTIKQVIDLLDKYST